METWAQWTFNINDKGRSDTMGPLYLVIFLCHRTGCILKFITIMKSWVEGSELIKFKQFSIFDL
jgi:hypothetical protein